MVGKKGGSQDAQSEASTLFENPERWFETFQTQRKAYESLMDTQRQKREALENELGVELQKAAEEYAKVSPVAPEEVEAIPRRRAAYSDRMASLMCKLAMLAYVRFEEPGKKAILESALQRAGLRLVDTCAVNDVEAFIAESEYFMVVAFRGTTTAQDRKVDFSIGIERTQIDGYDRPVKVHAGFYRAYLTIEQQIRMALGNSKKAVYLTGHSLGGAIALVTSAAFGGGDALGDRVAAVYTFGAPRVGDDHFSDSVKAPHYRIINSGDFVPLVPPNWISGYRHTGEQRILQEKSDRFARKRRGGGLAFLLLWSLLLYMFRGRKLLMVQNHDVSVYAARLERIARKRGRWT